MIKKEAKVVSKKVKKPTKVTEIYPEKTNKANIYLGLRVQIVNKFVPNPETISDYNKKEKDIISGKIDELNKEIQKGLFGVIVEKNYEYVVEFEKEYDFTYSYNEFFKDKRYFIFDNLDNIQSTKSEEETERESLAGFFYNAKKSAIEKEIGDVENKKSYILNKKRDIESYKQNIKELSRRIATEELLLKDILSGEAFKSIDREMIDLSISKMRKNPKIESITVEDDEIGNSFLIVTTTDLLYSSPRCSYQIGKFKLKLDANSKPMAVNTTRVYGSGSRFHPCVNGSFGMCLGSQVENHVMKLIKFGDFGGAITTLINFLEEPNYGTPYIDDIEFYGAQPVTVKPKTELEWFDTGIWASQKFDSDLFSETVEAFRQKLKKK